MLFRSRSCGRNAARSRWSGSERVIAFTAGSAYLNHDEDAGTLSVGRRADIAVLDHDVLVDGFAANGTNPIDDASVVMTVANGRVVFES